MILMDLNTWIADNQSHVAQIHTLKTELEVWILAGIARLCRVTLARSIRRLQKRRLVA